MPGASRSYRPIRALCAVLLCAGIVLPVTAGASPDPGEDNRPVLRLDAQASAEVRQDTAIAVLFLERDGPEPSALQHDANAVLAQATQTLKAIRSLKVRSGSYSVQPRRSRDGSIVAWRLRAELIIESTDIDAVSNASGSMAGTLSVSSIRFALSKAKRDEVEKDLVHRAAENFYARARIAASALGYPEMELIEANYNGSAAPPTPFMRTMAAAAPEASAVPMQPGESTVTVTFSGSLRLKR